MNRVPPYFLMLMFALACLAGCGSDEPPGAVEKRDAGSTVTGFSVSLIEEGSQSYQIEAATAQLSVDMAIADMTDVRIIQMENNQQFGEITADKGVFYMEAARDAGRKAEDVVLRGNVRVRREDGFLLRTNKAIISGSQKKMFSDADVELEAPMEDGRVMKSAGAAFELDLVGEGFSDVNFRIRGKSDRQARLTFDLDETAMAVDAEGGGP